MFRIIFYTINIMIILMIIFLFVTNKDKNNSLKNRISKLEARHQKLAVKSEKLKNNIKLFKESESYQKYVIRREMGFIDKNDMIYIFDKK